MHNELTNQALPVGDVGTPIALYSIYPRKRPVLGRLSLVNDRTDHERSNGWVCDVSVLVRQDDAQALLDAKEAELAALRQNDPLIANLKEAVAFLRQCQADPGVARDVGALKDATSWVQKATFAFVDAQAVPS